MEEVVLEPRPGRCVETVARQRYWRQVDALMKRLAEDTDPGELEEEIDLLLSFLETADVASIRRQTEDLMEEGHHVRVVLRRRGGGDLHVDIERAQP